LATYDPSVDIPHPTFSTETVISSTLCGGKAMGKQTALTTGGRPMMGRRPSCDLFEAVENKEFSEREARYIFRQIGECAHLA
jgi:hypothetical protein